MPRVAVALVMLAVAAAAAFGSDASGQAPGTRTITLTETERGATFTHIRNTSGAPRRANLQGDVLAFTSPLLDAAGARAGKLSMSCTTTTGARDFARSTITCVGVFALRDGAIIAQGNVDLDSRTQTVAVVGGTGAYAGARGQLVSEEGRGGSTDTITLIG